MQRETAGVIRGRGDHHYPWAHRVEMDAVSGALSLRPKYR